MRRVLLLIVVVLLPVAAAPVRGEVDPRRVTPVVKVFEATRDSVVNISSTQVIEVRSPFGFDSFFDFGFDPFSDLRGRQRRITRTSVGSGFVLHEAGYIVTNAHVVARTAERKAIFADGSEFDAQIVALDEPHDLAILKIDPSSPNGTADADPGRGETPGGSGGTRGSPRVLKPIRLGTSSDLMVGETVIAIGNPFGYQHTVTAGVVSATDRELPIDEERSLTGLIQTDASINPGNSGGPLLNILGELVGINTAIRADAQNIGFAIPVDHLRDLLPAMLDVERRYRIVTGLSVSDEPREDGKGRRVRIDAVEPGSPAAAAGVPAAPGASITAIDGEPLRDAIDYYIALIGRSPGDVLELTLQLADGSEKAVSLTLGERPRPDGAALLLNKLGLEASPIDPAAARQMGLSRLRGLIITGVQLRGPADDAGLEPGDILIQLGRHQPTTLDEVGELLEGVQSGQTIDAAILRIAGRTIYRASTTLRVR